MLRITPIAFVGFILALMASPAIGATYLPLSDEALVLHSSLIVRGYPKGSVVARTADGELITLVTIEVEKRLKGISGHEIQLLLPGGADARGWSHVFGTPAFYQGTSVLLFLRPGPNRDGHSVYLLSEFGLSKFDVMEDVSGQRFAVRRHFGADEDRELSGIESKPSELSSYRLAESFEQVITQSGEPRQKYRTPHGSLTPVRTGKLLERGVNFVNYGGPEGGPCTQGGTAACLSRWFWDTGIAPTNTISGQSRNGFLATQSNLKDGSNGIQHLNDAVGLWRDIAGVDLRMKEDFLSAWWSPTIVRFDVETSQLWSSPSDCGSGGVIGAASIHGSGVLSDTATYKSYAYHPILRGAINIRKNVCATGYDVALFRLVLLHEIGHTLGLGHSNEAVSSMSTTTPTERSTAVMSTAANASLSAPQTDDIEAMRYYYPLVLPRLPTLDRILPSSTVGSGPVNVQIKGAYLTVPESVLFGGLAAGNVTLVDSSTLTAIIPARTESGTRTVDVTVIFADGRRSTLGGAFTFYAPPPVITSVTPSAGSSSGATQVVVMGENLLHCTVMFGSQYAAGLLEDTPTRLVIVSPIGSGTVDLSVIHEAIPEWKSTLPGAFSYKSCIAPSAQLSGDHSICLGATAVLEVALTGTPPFALLWNDGTLQDNIWSTPVTRQVNPAATTTYSLLAVSDAACGGSTAGSSVVSILAYTGVLSVTSRTDGTRSFSTVCANSYYHVYGGGGGWTISGGEFTSIGDNGRQFRAGSSGTVTISAHWTADGCPVDARIDLPVFGGPPVRIDAPEEVPAEAEATARVENAGAGATYSWWINNGVITAGGGSNEIRFMADGNGAVGLSIGVTTPEGCDLEGGRVVAVTKVEDFAIGRESCVGCLTESVLSDSGEVYTTQPISVFAPLEDLTVSVVTVTDASGRRVRSFVPASCHRQFTTVEPPVTVWSVCNGTYSYETDASVDWRISADGTLVYLRRDVSAVALATGDEATYLMTGNVLAGDYSVYVTQNIGAACNSTRRISGQASKLCGSSYWRCFFDWTVAQGPVSPECHSIDLSLLDPLVAVRSAGATIPAWTMSVAEPVQGIVADDTSIGILRFDSDLPDLVTVTASRNDVDIPVLYSYREDFHLPAFDTATASSTISVTPISTTTGYSSFALLRIPVSLLAGSTGSPILKVTTVQGARQGSISIPVYAPPLVTLHGIWSKATIWLAFSKYLRDKGYPSPAISIAGYETAAARRFTDFESQRAIDAALWSALSLARNRKIIATRVDVVAHSMGGVAARYFARRSNNPFYRAPENYMKGSVNRLLTVGTPHQGSEFARYLLDHKDNTVETGSLVWVLSQFSNLCQTGSVTSAATLAEFSNCNNQPVDEGGVASLVPGSAELSSLDDELPYVSIVGKVSQLSPALIALDAVIGSFDHKSSPGDNVNAIQKSFEHDTIVAAASQKGVSSSPYTVDGIVHAQVTGTDETETNSTRVFRLLHCLLRSDPDCGVLALASIPRAPSIDTTGLAEIDFSALAAVSASNISITPATGATIPLGSSTAVTYSSQLRSVVRVITVNSGLIFDDNTAPFTMEVNPESAEPVHLQVIALFSDNTYSISAVDYSTQPLTTVTQLETGASSVALKRIGQKHAIVVLATLGDRVIEVTDGSAFSVQSAASIVEVDESGVITARSNGSGIVLISYGGMDTSVLVTVNARVRGDSTGDGLVNPGDLVYLVNYLVAHGPDPIGPGDANADGAVTIADVFYLVNYIFAGGPAPADIE